MEIPIVQFLYWLLTKIMNTCLWNIIFMFFHSRVPPESFILKIFFRFYFLSVTFVDSFSRKKISIVLTILNKSLQTYFVKRWKIKTMDHALADLGGRGRTPPLFWSNFFLISIQFYEKFGQMKGLRSLPLRLRLAPLSRKSWIRHYHYRNMKGPWLEPK